MKRSNNAGVSSNKRCRRSNCPSAGIPIVRRGRVFKQAFPAFQLFGAGIPIVRCGRVFNQAFPAPAFQLSGAVIPISAAKETGSLGKKVFTRLLVLSSQI